MRMDRARNSRGGNIGSRHMILVAALAAAAGPGVAASGQFDVAATTPHASVTNWTLTDRRCRQERATRADTIDVAQGSATT